MSEQPPDAGGDYGITPHFRASQFSGPVSFEQSVAIFADAIRGFQLDIAERLMAAEPHGGIAALSISMSYFEMIAKCRRGDSTRGPSRVLFDEGFAWVLGASVESLSDQQRDAIFILWDEVRNGLYHEAGVGGSVVLSGTNPDAIGLRTTAEGRSEIVINPRALVGSLQGHFSGYIADLLNPSNTELRENFARLLSG